MPVNRREPIDRELKSKFLMGVERFFTPFAFEAIPVLAARRINWDEVLLPTIEFGLIQVVTFCALHFARKYSKAGNSLIPAALVIGLYCLSVGLLLIYWMGRWGIITPIQQKSNYEDFTIFVLVVMFIVFLLFWRRKLQ
jgi:hypothetical protein